MFFKRFFIPCALAACVALMSGCSLASSDSSDTTTTTLDGAAYTTLTDNGLTHAESSVSGNGTIIFNSPLSAIASKASFELSFTLSDGGSLEFRAFTTNSLASGVSYLFERSGSSLTVTLGAAGSTENVTSSFSSVSATGTISLQIDHHNDETPDHTLVWSGSDFSEDAAIFNSEDGPATPGNGSGTFWGFVLASANVNTAVAGDPKFVEP